MLQRRAAVGSRLGLQEVPGLKGLTFELTGPAGPLQELTCALKTPAPMGPS